MVVIHVVSHANNTSGTLHGYLKVTSSSSGGRIERAKKRDVYLQMLHTTRFVQCLPFYPDRYGITFYFPSIYLLDRQVTGKCGSSGIADSPWAACLVAEEGGVCPHNFKKLDSDGTCGPRSRKTPAWKDRVCCLLGPAFDLKVNKARRREMYCYRSSKTSVNINYELTVGEESNTWLLSSKISNGQNKGVGVVGEKTSTNVSELFA